MAVLNKHRDTIPEDAVYIGRGSKWGNPFKITAKNDRDTVCELYKARLLNQIADKEITIKELAALHGKDLVCFCAPRRCHGHTLEQFAEKAAKGEGYARKS